MAPGEATITVRLDDFPDGSELGVWLEFSDQLYILPVDAASWLSDVVHRQVELAQEIIAATDVKQSS